MQIAIYFREYRMPIAWAWLSRFSKEHNFNVRNSPMAGPSHVPAWCEAQRKV
jgi:hypothetical protein